MTHADRSGPSARSAPAHQGSTCVAAPRLPWIAMGILRSAPPARLQRAVHAPYGAPNLDLRASQHHPAPWKLPGRSRSPRAGRAKMQTMPTGYRRAGLRPGTPCPVQAFGRHSVPQCRPVPAFGRHSRAPVQAVPAFGRALRAPVPAFGRRMGSSPQCTVALSASWTKIRLWVSFGV